MTEPKPAAPARGRLTTWIVRVMRLHARWRARRGVCVCCGVFEPGTHGTAAAVCFACYWRWTFDGWRPWWLKLEGGPR